MSISTRPPDEMSPQERREEVARLLARGVVRLHRRALKSQRDDLPPALLDANSTWKNDLRTPAK